MIEDTIPRRRSRERGNEQDHGQTRPGDQPLGLHFRRRGKPLGRGGGEVALRRTGFCRSESSCPSTADTSEAVWKRSPGSFACSFSMTAATASGTAGLGSRTGRGLFVGDAAEDRQGGGWR